MDRWKRGIALLICLVFLASFPTIAYAMPTGDEDIPAEDIFADELPEGLQYTVTGATATVTGYTGALTELVLPSSIEGVPLTAIAPGALQNTQLISVTLPACVQQIGAAALAAPSMVTICVEEGNAAYCHDSRGILYNKKMTALVQLPGAYTGVLFLPETVSKIQSGALAGCGNVTGIFGVNSNIAVDPQENASGIGLHFGYQRDLCPKGCLFCPDCGGWFTPEGEAAPSHYTVTFLDRNGAELDRRLLHEADAVQQPAPPDGFEDQTYRYTFAGWDREVTSCTEDAVYTATYKIAGLTGDFNDDGAVSQRDAICLLRCFLNMPGYTMNQSGDMDDDGVISDEDAAYLLRFTLFPSRYPLHPKL